MIWFILTLVILLIWAIPAFRTLQKMDKQSAPLWRIPFAHLIDEPEEAAIVFFLLGIVFAVGGYTILHGRGTLRDIVGDFYANIAMECISVAITVLIIERLYERRSKLEGEKAEKERLILQMGSPDNAFAVEAVRQLAKRGWLYDGSLKEADLRKADLSRADLFKANLSKANLMQANLHNADLHFACLSGTHLIGINLSKATLRDADLSEAILAGANLAESKLGGINLGKAYLLGANLTKADLESANLIEANLHYANLSKASLFKAYVCGANMNGVNLTGAYLVRADLNEAELSGAKYDFDTQWPDGFDPKAAGAIEVEWNEELQEWIPVNAS